jgi:N utilization substance protein A
MNDGAALGLVLDQVSKDKNIDRAVLVETLEQAILTAAKRAFGMHREMEAKFNEETGRVDLFQIIVIVDQVTPGRGVHAVVPIPAGPIVPASLESTGGNEVALEEAVRYGLKAEVGDELLFQIFYDEKDQAKAEEQDAKYGELLKLNRAWKGFGRIAAQTAKQVILQRVREAERENVFNQYKDRKGELISGIVRRFERGNIIIDLGGAEAVLPVRDQVPRESYRAGDRIVAFVVDIDKTARGPQIILSRTHKGLLEKLFEMEVPEIYEKIVRIEASAREAGARSKIAVSSRDRDVDPVGACVGMKGLARAGRRAGAARREDRHRSLRSGSGALRVQRDRARRGRARDHRRRQPHDGADRPRREAVAGDRQEGAERTPRVAAHRLAHRHPLGDEGARDGSAGAPVAGGDQAGRRW